MGTTSVTVCAAEMQVAHLLPVVAGASNKTSRTIHIHIHASPRKQVLPGSAQYLGRAIPAYTSNTTYSIDMVVIVKLYL